MKNDDLVDGLKCAVAYPSGPGSSGCAGFYVTIGEDITIEEAQERNKYGLIWIPTDKGIHAPLDKKYLQELKAKLKTGWE